MDLQLIELVEKYRTNGKFVDSLNICLGILKSYNLNINSKDLTEFSEYIRSKLLILYYNLHIILRALDKFALV